MKKIPLMILSVLILIQFAIPYTMIQRHEAVLRDGALLKFKTRPIDPVDYMQGRYVWLGFDQDFVPDTTFKKGDLRYNERIFVVLKADEEGFAQFTDWSREQPAEGDYIKTHYAGLEQDWDRKNKVYIKKGIRFDIPFDQYFMEENKAPRAEALVREATLQTNCWVNVRILGGKTVIEDVFVEGQSIQDLSREKE